ncbi:hypothetical protein AUS43_24785, partial [Escherichia coli]
SRGITATKSFRFHFSGHQRLTIFVFELQSDGEGAKSFIVSAIIQPELVSTNISREPYRICKRRLSTVWQILKFLRE